MALSLILSVLWFLIRETAGHSWQVGQTGLMKTDWATIESLFNTAINNGKYNMRYDRGIMEPLLGTTSSPKCYEMMEIIPNPGTSQVVVLKMNMNDGGNGMMWPSGAMEFVGSDDIECKCNLNCPVDATPSPVNTGALCTQDICTENQVVKAGQRCALDPCVHWGCADPECGFCDRDVCCEDKALCNFACPGNRMTKTCAGAICKDSDKATCCPEVKYPYGSCTSTWRPWGSNQWCTLVRDPHATDINGRRFEFQHVLGNSWLYKSNAFEGKDLFKVAVRTERAWHGHQNRYTAATAVSVQGDLACNKKFEIRARYQRQAWGVEIPEKFLIDDAEMSPQEWMRQVGQCEKVCCVTQGGWNFRAENHVQIKFWGGTTIQIANWVPNNSAWGMNVKLQVGDPLRGHGGIGICLQSNNWVPAGAPAPKPDAGDPELPPLGRRRLQYPDVTEKSEAIEDEGLPGAPKDQNVDLPNWMHMLDALNQKDAIDNCPPATINAAKPKCEVCKQDGPQDKGLYDACLFDACVGGDPTVVDTLEQTCKSLKNAVVDPDLKAYMMETPFKGQNPKQGKIDMAGLNAIMDKCGFPKFEQKDWDALTEPPVKKAASQGLNLEQLQLLFLNNEDKYDIMECYKKGNFAKPSDEDVRKKATFETAYVHSQWEKRTTPVKKGVPGTGGQPVTCLIQENMRRTQCLNYANVYGAGDKDAFSYNIDSGVCRICPATDEKFADARNAGFIVMEGKAGVAMATEVVNTGNEEEDDDCFWPTNKPACADGFKLSDCDNGMVLDTEAQCAFDPCSVPTDKATCCVPTQSCVDAKFGEVHICQEGTIPTTYPGKQCKALKCTYEDHDTCCETAGSCDDVKCGDFGKENIPGKFCNAATCDASHENLCCADMAPMPTLAPTKAVTQAPTAPAPVEAPTDAPVEPPVTPQPPACRPPTDVKPDEKPEACGTDVVAPPCWEERDCGTDIDVVTDNSKCPLVNIFDSDDEKDCDGYIVALFAPWCGPCQEMMQTLVGLTKSCNVGDNKVCFRAILYDTKPGGKYSEIFSKLTADERETAEEKIKIFRTTEEETKNIPGTQQSWVYGSNFFETVGKDDFLLFDENQRLVSYVPFMTSLNKGVHKGANLDNWDIFTKCKEVPMCPEPPTTTECKPGQCGTDCSNIDPLDKNKYKSGKCTKDNKCDTENVNVNCDEDDDCTDKDCGAGCNVGGKAGTCNKEKKCMTDDKKDKVVCCDGCGKNCHTGEKAGMCTKEMTCDTTPGAKPTCPKEGCDDKDCGDGCVLNGQEGKCNSNNVCVTDDTNEGKVVCCNACGAGCHDGLKEGVCTKEMTCDTTPGAKPTCPTDKECGENDCGNGCVLNGKEGTCNSDKVCVTDPTNKPKVVCCNACGAGCHDGLKEGKCTKEMTCDTTPGAAPTCPTTPTDKECGEKDCGNGCVLDGKEGTCNANKVCVTDPTNKPKVVCCNACGAGCHDGLKEGKCTKEMTCDTSVGAMPTCPGTTECDDDEIYVPSRNMCIRCIAPAKWNEKMGMCVEGEPCGGFCAVGTTCKDNKCVTDCDDDDVCDMFSCKEMLSKDQCKSALDAARKMTCDMRDNSCKTKDQCPVAPAPGTEKQCKDFTDKKLCPKDGPVCKWKKGKCVDKN